MTQTKAELLQTRHQGDIRLGDANSSHYVGFKAPATVSSSLVWTLPAADGTANYLLKTDGSGNLGWVADSTTDSTKMPLAGGSFTGDVTFTGDSANIVFDKSDNALEFADNAKATLGTGADLEVYHNGQHSFIKHLQGSGNFFIESVANIAFKVATNESALNLNSNGSVELYHNNVKKFETTSTGVDIPDTLRLSDSWADTGTQMCLGADTNGIGHIAVHTLKFNTGANNSRSTAITIDSSQRLLVGHTATVDTSTYNSNLQVMGTDAHGSSTIIGRFSNDAGAPSLHLTKSRNTTKGSHTIVNDNDGVGNIFWWASDGSDYEQVAQIGAEIDGTPGSNDTPGALTFSTTDDGASTSTEAMRIDRNGRVGIGIAPDTNSRLHIHAGSAGSVSAGTNSTVTIENSGTTALQFLSPNDAVQQIRFGDVADTGRGFIEYSHASNEMKFSGLGGNIILNSSGNTTFPGMVSDSIGELRQIPQRSVSSVTLAASDVGKAILATSTVTVPNGVFSSGDAVTIINNSGSDITISKGISTMYLASDGSSANRTLATRGMATIWFSSSSVAYISGAGLS